MATKSASSRRSNSIEVLDRIEHHLAALCAQSAGDSRTWLTVKEVGEELRVSRDTVERLIASGKLKAAAITTSVGNGRRKLWRISREWVDEFLLNAARQSGAEKTAAVKRRKRLEGEVDFIK